MVFIPADTVDRTPRTVVELPRSEAMGLMASVAYGRVVFTDRAMPAIRPVNHLVDNGRIIVRTRLVSTVAKVARSYSSSGVVVAYETDDLDPANRTGWSVVVVGPASTITDPVEIAHFEQLLRPWVNMAMDTVIAIEPTIVTGIRIIADTR